MVDAHDHRQATQAVQVSVLVPTRERPEQLEACVSSILASDHTSFEVIVIDQSPTPSLNISDPRLRVIHVQTRGKSAALNEAMKQALGRLFAFTDDDCTVYPDWLARGQELLDSRPEADLIQGALLAIPHNPSLWYVPAFSPGSLELVSGAGKARLRGGAGANMFARRQLFERIGGFDGAIGPGAPFRSCEEFDIYYRALHAGAKVLRDPENAVLHWGKRSHSDGSARRLVRDYFYGEGAVLAKHVRSGDSVALWLSFNIVVRELLVLSCSRLARGDRVGMDLTGIWLSGFARGLRTPVNPSRRLFADTVLNASPVARRS